MEKSKKIISLLLALIMTLSVFTIVPFSAGAAQADVSPAGATETDVSPVGATETDVSPAGAPESYTDIHVGDRLYPIELNSGETTYFKFVPERNMRIFFYTRFSIFSIAFLYDAQMNQLKSGNSFNLFYDVLYKIHLPIVAGTHNYIFIFFGIAPLRFQEGCSS